MRSPGYFHYVLLTLFCSLTLGDTAEPNRPIMGFDTYYSGWNGTTDISKAAGRTNVYCGASEQFMFIMATNYLRDGLHALGYDWMCISDGWQGGRDGNGDIYADRERFPNGMAHTIEVLHQLGFKVRLYTEVGDGLTCCGKVKSRGAYGLNDARTFATWKVDGVTVDTCNDARSDGEKQAAHKEFIGYLHQNEVPINYDLHVAPMPGQYTGGMAEWMAQVDSWQFTIEWGYIDPVDVWNDAIGHIDLAAMTTTWMRPSHTPNLLIISGDLTAYRGNFGKLLFTFWSMFQSPLVVPEDYVSYPGWDGGKYQTNSYCIAIDQDPLFAPPVKMFTNGAHSEVWVKPLASGATALAFLNRTNADETITVTMEALGVERGARYTLIDAWNHTNRQSTAATQSFASPPRSAQLWVLGPRRPPAPALAIAGTNVIVRWPVTAGCRLECSNWPEQGKWTAVTNRTFQHRDLKRVEIPANRAAEFYRIVMP